MDYLSTGIGMLWNNMQSNTAFGRQRHLMDIQQLKQQELNQQQYENQRRLNDQGAKIQEEMWRKTNYPAQVKMLKDAGLNPALLYGMKGGGGVTTGSQGGGSAQGGSASGGTAPMPNYMDLGQMALLNADIKLKEAQAKALNAQATGTEFENSIRDKYRSQIELARSWEWTSTGVKSEEEWKAWQIRKEILYGGDKEWKPGQSNNYADQLDREIATAKENLLQLYQKGDILEFQKEIDKFGANLAKNGISPDSPWYAKLMVDMLEKVGLGKIVREILTGN
jgi:hypothetical protein